MSEYCCGQMEFHLKNNEICLIYVPKVRAYGIAYKPRCGGGMQQIIFCPWCGSKLPEDLSEKRWEIVIDELGYQDFDDPRLPEEFKTDEWWKKRSF